MAKKLYSITRGLYGCSAGKNICVINDMAVFKKLMIKSNYVFDAERERFHNDTTRMWYKVTEIDVIEDENINEWFQKYEDIANRNYKKRKLTSTQSTPKFNHKTSIKGMNGYC